MTHTIPKTKLLLWLLFALAFTTYGPLGCPEAAKIVGMP